MNKKKSTKSAPKKPWIFFTENDKKTLITIIFSDYTSGFGGKFGVQNDRVDKSAMGWDHIEKVEKHDSQKGTYF